MDKHYTCDSMRPLKDVRKVHEHFMLDPYLDRILIDEAKTRDVPKTSIVEDALRMYFGVQLNRPNFKTDV